MATAQAQAAIEQLKAAGLRRGQFKVTTERHYAGRHPETGKAMYEYGYAKISLVGIQREFIPYAPALAKAGLHVEIWKFANITTLYVTTDGKPGLWEKDYTDKDEYGLPKSRKVALNG